MILSPRADIALPELDEPICCTDRFTDNEPEKTRLSPGNAIRRLLT